MIDVDERVDRELQLEYERLEAESPPAWLVNFDPKSKRSRSRHLRALAGIVGFAVVAAGVATFGIELSRHPHPVSPATHAPLAAAPTVTTSEFPASALVVLPVKQGSGTATLPSVVASGHVLYLAFDCDGDAVLKIQTKGDGALTATQPTESVLTCSKSTNPERIYVAN